MNKTFIAAIAAGMLLATSVAAISAYSANKPKLSYLLPVTIPAAATAPLTITAQPVHPVSYGEETEEFIQPVYEDTDAVMDVQLGIAGDEDEESEEQTENKSIVLNYNYPYFGDYFSEGADLLIAPIDYANVTLTFIRKDEPDKKTAYTMVAEYDERSKTFYFTHATKKEIWFGKGGKVTNVRETYIDGEGELYFFDDCCIWNYETESIKDHVFRYARKPSDAPVKHIDLDKIKAERAKVLAAIENEDNR